MNTNDIAKRNDKSEKLKVFRLQDGQFYVESAEGKICYKVVISNGTKSCACADYTNRIEKDPTFLCKHILAVINGNGNIKDIEIAREQPPRLDERFIIEIEGREFVKYPGLLDLGHQKGIVKIDVDPVQYPTKENGMFAICKALIVSSDGRTFTDVGDANPDNCSSKVRKHVLRMASTRAIARALRSYTNIGMTCLEELGDFDEASEGDVRSKTRAKRESRTAATKPEQQKGGATTDDRKEEKKQTPKDNQTGQKPADSGAKASGEKKKDSKASDTENTKAKPSSAQVKAILSLAERRGINGEQLVKIFTDKFQKPYEEIDSNTAKDFIKYLQQAA